MERASERVYRTYGELLQDVSRAADVDPQGALALLTEFGPQFAPQLGHVYLFRASLANRSGRGAEALALLREAHGHGMRFPERVLRSSRGLASLAGDATFEGLIQDLDASYAQAQSTTQPTLDADVPSGPTPTGGWPAVIALHGNNATPALERQQWRSLTDMGWLVAFPGSSQPAWTPGYLIWDDRDAAHRDVAEAIRGIDEQFQVNHARLVLGGFSAGGLRAIEVALNGTARASRVLTVAAYLTEDLLKSMTIAPVNAGRLRVFMVIGEQDTSAAAHQTLAEHLTAAGATCVVDLRAGLGHSYPDDMSRTLTKAMEFLET